MSCCKPNEIQELLDEHARLSNYSGHEEKVAEIEAQLKVLRGTTPPICHGWDDCSTMMLVHCPWRIDCG